MHRALVAGGLSDCAQVESVVFEDMEAIEQGAVSDTFRIRLAYRDDDRPPGPENVIVKPSSRKHSVRRTSRFMSVYAVECEFYLRISALAQVAVPRLFCGDFDKRDHSLALILEDIGDMESVQFREGASPERAITAVRSVEKLHAAFWNREGSPILSRVP